MCLNCSLQLQGIYFFRRINMVYNKKQLNKGQSNVLEPNVKHRTHHHYRELRNRWRTLHQHA